jgi:hypothetical protein
MTNQDIHNEITSSISSITGCEDVESVFLNPNKYGNITGHFSFKYNVCGKYNYNAQDFTIDYKLKQLFIRCIGYFILKEMTAEETIKTIKRECPQAIG